LAPSDGTLDHSDFPDFVRDHFLTVIVIDRYRAARREEARQKMPRAAGAEPPDGNPFEPDD